MCAVRELDDDVVDEMSRDASFARRLDAYNEMYRPQSNSSSSSNSGTYIVAASIASALGVFVLIALRLLKTQMHGGPPPEDVDDDAPAMSAGEFDARHALLIERLKNEQLQRKLNAQNANTNEFVRLVWLAGPALVDDAIRD